MPRCLVPVSAYGCRRDDRTAATHSANSAITPTQAHNEWGPDTNAEIAVRPTKATAISTAYAATRFIACSQ